MTHSTIVPERRKANSRAPVSFNGMILQGEKLHPQKSRAKQSAGIRTRLLRRLGLQTGRYGVGEPKDKPPATNGGGKKGGTKGTGMNASHSAAVKPTTNGGKPPRIKFRWVNTKAKKLQKRVPNFNAAAGRRNQFKSATEGFNTSLLGRGKHFTLRRI